MKLLFKGVFYIGIVVVGGLLAVNYIPSLKANILEIVNPRVQEEKLVRTLQQNLEQLNNALPDEGAVSSVVVRSSKQLISESQDLLRQISDINEEHAGIVDGIVSRVTDTIIGTVSSPTPSPSPSSTAATASTTSSPVTTPCVP